MLMMHRPVVKYWSYSNSQLNGDLLKGTLKLRYRCTVIVILLLGGVLWYTDVLTATADS